MLVSLGTIGCRANDSVILGRLVDAGSKTEVPDVGFPQVVVDAGFEVDAGVVPDAGVEVDAGFPEADAGVTPDAGADSTTVALDEYWSQNGGRDAFPASYVDAVETLIRAEDEVVQGEYAAALARIDTIFARYPLSDPIWGPTAGVNGTNAGTPMAYYGLRMLDEIASAGLRPPPNNRYTITMTVVLVACAQGVRPTDVELTTEEAVDLTLNPSLAANDHFIIRQSLQLFQHYVHAMTGGKLDLELEFQSVDVCQAVTFDSNPAFSGLVDYAMAIEPVPADVKARTDMWWVLYPSNVPSNPIFNNSEFVTGGMGSWGTGAPVFIIDDLWLVRKPPHLGQGLYTDIERRIYLPQWLQHEFFHHLFRTWPEFGLEATGHQWLDRSTWPDDFVGAWEPDYYAEALRKRLKTATPSLTYVLRVARPLVDLAPITADDIVGTYTRLPVDNPWHEVTVSEQAGQLIWSNQGGAQWSLIWANGRLEAGPDCPYENRNMRLELPEDEDGNVILQVDGLWFLGELYERQNP